jgi:hypothetical protein
MGVKTQVYCSPPGGYWRVKDRLFDGLETRGYKRSRGKPPCRAVQGHLQGVSHQPSSDVGRARLASLDFSDRDQYVKRKHRKNLAEGVRASAAARRRASGLRFERLEARLAMAVVINEFLASNADGIADEDGDNSDWIELKNTGVAAVNLDGWHLTDDAGNFSKWTLPSTVLSPGATLTIFASDKDRAVSGQELHTNFKLSAAGGYLGLVDDDGVTVVDAYAAYPPQLTDVSYGVGTDPGVTATETLVGDSTPLRVISPSSENAARDDFWREIVFDDSTWLTGTDSVGYDRNGATDGTFSINRVLTTGEMPTSSTQTSAYVRYAFNLANKEQLSSLSLTLKFDDGFMAFINGREVKQVNFGDDFTHTTPAWNSRAGNFQTSTSMVSANRGSEATSVVTFDLTPYLPSLVNGANVLAFHMVNGASGTATSDLLLDPELTATRTSGTQLGFMMSPSPGGENGVATQGVVNDTHFSVDRGFYAAPISVAITTDTPGASIRYTTDGSLPSATNGTLYVGPINIATTTIMRAIAYQAGYTPSNVDTQTYIFLSDIITQSSSDAIPGAATWGHSGPDWAMDPDVVGSTPASQQAVIDALQAIPTVSLVMNPGDLFGGTPLPGTPTASPVVAPQGIYISGKSSERAASFEYFNPLNPLDQTHADIAVEIQGHSSVRRWFTDKLSMQIKFKYPFGDTELNYPLFAGTPGGENATSEFDTLILDAIFNYGWNHSNLLVQSNFARFVTDQAVADLQNLASGGSQAAHGRYVHLYLNGVYWGMYDMHERPDDSFAAEAYGGDKDDYYVVKSTSGDLARNYSEVAGGITAELNYMALVTASRAVEASPTSAANYNAVKGMLDVDQLIDYMIVHYYAGGGNDWPHNNWYASRDSAGGVWRFHAWDQEHAFPTTDNGDGFSQTTDITGEEGNDDETPGEIHHNLIKNDEYRLRFADRVQELMYNGGALTETVAQAVYEARTNEIDQAIIAESARWGDNRNATDPYTRADFITTKNNLLAAFFPARTNAVRGHFNARTWIPTLVAPVFSQYGGNISSGFSLTLSKPAGSPATAKIYYTLDGSDPRILDPILGPIVRPGAIEYTAPIELFNTKNVRARIFDSAQTGTKNDWSPEVDKTFTTPITYPVRITELHYHPQATEEQEFLELLNTGSSAVSLDNVQIRDFANTPYSFPTGLTLGAGERIVVPKNPTIFQQVYGTSITIAGGGYGTQNLSNGGETVSLYWGVELVQSITYSDLGLWPMSPDGDGPSLEIIDPLGNPSSPSNWRASAVLGGSPGHGGMLGDFDDNGQVDGNDFLTWQRGLGGSTPSAIAHGDADGDHDVDAADLGVWKGEYGEPLLVAAVVAANDEPADEAFAAALAGDEWILTSSLSTAPAPKEAVRARPADAAFAAWDGRPAYRPWSAATRDSGRRVSIATNDDSDETEAIVCELDEALASGV